MKVLKIPLSVHPEHSGQVQKAFTVFMNMKHYFDPIRVDPMIRVEFAYLLNWGKLWLQLRRDLEKEHDACSAANLTYLHIVTKYLMHVVV